MISGSLHFQLRFQDFFFKLINLQNGSTWGGEFLLFSEINFRVRKFLIVKLKMLYCKWLCKVYILKNDFTCNAIDLLVQYMISDRSGDKENASYYVLWVNCTYIFILNWTIIILNSWLFAWSCKEKEIC